MNFTVLTMALNGQVYQNLSREEGLIRQPGGLTIVLWFINPQHMREGYGSRSVCVSVTKLAATYLVCESKMQLCKVPYGVPNTRILWISLKTLCSPVLASFADAKLLDFSPASGSMT